MIRRLFGIAALAVIPVGQAPLAVAETAAPAPLPPEPPSCSAASGPFFLGVAPNGTVFAMQPSATVYRFAAGAHGDAAPDATFCFTTAPEERLYGLGAAADQIEVLADGSLFAFSPTSSGPVQPLRYVHDPQYGVFGKPGILNKWGPFQMALGSDGSAYILRDTSCHCSAGGTESDVIEFLPHATGNVAPSNYFVPVDPASRNRAGLVADDQGYDTYAEAIALGASSRFFFLDDSGDIVVSRPGIKAPWAREARIALAANYDTQRPFAVDGAGTVYVADRSIVRVVTGATGASPVVTKLAGSKTHLSDVEGLATDASGKLYVENCAGAGTSILVFRSASFGNAAPLYSLGGPHTNLTCTSSAIVADDASRATRIEGTIYLDDRNPADPVLPADATVRVQITRTIKGSAQHAGKVFVYPVVVLRNGKREVRYSAFGLPTDVELDVWVETAPLPNAPPPPSTAGFHLIHFRPTDPKLQLSEVYAVTLTRAHPAATGRDFVPYELEVPPMPEGVPSPAPSST